MTQPSNSPLSADDQRIIDEAHKALTELTGLVKRLSWIRRCCWPGCFDPIESGDAFCRTHYFRLPYGHMISVKAALEWVRKQATRAPSGTFGATSLTLVLSFGVA